MSTYTDTFGNEIELEDDWLDEDVDLDDWDIEGQEDGEWIYENALHPDEVMREGL